MAENVGIDRVRIWWWSVVVPLTGTAAAGMEWIAERKEWLNDPEREGKWLGIWHAHGDEFDGQMEFRFSNANTAMEFKLRWA